MCVVHFTHRAPRTAHNAHSNAEHFQLSHFILLSYSAVRKLPAKIDARNVRKSFILVLFFAQFIVGFVNMIPIVEIFAI